MMGPSMLTGDLGQQYLASRPTMTGMVDLTPPAEPFAWGAGGAHLTPDQLELRQKLALQQQQADYSPIQSPWQGLARVAQNITGALDEKVLDKEASAINADRQQSVAALLGGGGTANSTVAAALASPDPLVQKLGMAQWERANPKPVNNDTVADYNFRVQTLGQQAADEWLKRGNDPFITATLPGGQFYAGPQSGFASAMQPQVSAPATGVPQAGSVQDGYRFKGGDPSNQANWEKVN